MSDILCRVCSEPWDAYGVHHGDMMAWEARLFKAGAGCPSCRGLSPEGETTEQAEERSLEAVRTMESEWDDPDSFPLVLDTFASALGAPMPPRAAWQEPEREIIWTCSGCDASCVRELQFSLSEENAADQRFAWQGGRKVHGYYGSSYRLENLPGADDPEEKPPFTIGDKPYCSHCVKLCDGPDCRTPIFQLAELQVDTYAPGSAFLLEGEYLDSYCLECYERLSSEQEDEAELTRRRDLAREIWRWKDIGYTNEMVRARIERERR